MQSEMIVLQVKGSRSEKDLVLLLLFPSKSPFSYKKCTISERNC